MPTQRITVDVLALIEAIEAKKDQRAKALAKQADEYQKSVGKAAMRLRAQLVKHIAAIDAGENPFGRYGGCEWGLVSGPRKPDVDTSDLERDLKVLKLCSEPTIVLTTDSHYAGYL